MMVPLNARDTFNTSLTNNTAFWATFREWGGGGGGDKKTIRLAQVSKHAVPCQNGGRGK